MQSTSNYLWRISDILGRGATANVYRGRHKKTGDSYAVKVFNRLSFLRPLEVQMREFEVLRKLNHKNIVKLFDVEDENSSRSKVLVMEFCSCGSLYTVLEEPANAFGLPESEFLIVLQDVVAGMNHLRENGIVHRDIKPGNIMRVIGEDGKSIYKLTDFGAARELEDDEQFVSLYGTEEYLHPDMYERAVLRKEHQKKYKATVDLWSIGVTFYHAATGSLPFRPFEGPRGNKEVMYELTAPRSPGCHRRFGGLKSASRPLACHCERSQSDQLTPDRTNGAYCFSFSKHVSVLTEVLEKLYMYVHLEMEKYRFQKTCFVHAYVSINPLTLIPVTNIIRTYYLFFSSCKHIFLIPMQDTQNFYLMRGLQPLFLCHKYCDNQDDFFSEAIMAPKMHPRYDLDRDASDAKSITDIVCYACRISSSLLLLQELSRKGVRWLIEIIKEDYNETVHKKSEVFLVLNFYSRNIEKIEKMCVCIISHIFIFYIYKEHLKGLEAVVGLEPAGWVEIILSLVVHACRWEQSVPDNWLQNTQPKLVCVEKLRVLFDLIFAIYQQFKKEKAEGRLSYNEEQIHKFDKQKLYLHATRAVSLFKEECYQKFQLFLIQMEDWLRKVLHARKQLLSVASQLIGIEQEVSMYGDHINKLQDMLPQKTLAASGGMKPSGTSVYSSPNTLVEMTLG
uniref:TANK binding kinase 1 n=1 Tax=Latimeria chalumnae TaxID=7897 RepID=H3B1U8_LATCH